MDVFEYIILSVLALITVIMALVMMRDSKYRDSYNKMLNAKLDTSIDEYTKRIEYTDRFLKYLDTLIALTSNVMFQEWLNRKKHPGKILRSHVQALISDVATRIHKSIDMGNVQQELLLANNEYWTWYIVNVTMVHINKKFEEALIDIVDE